MFTGSLYAISDIHMNFTANWREIEKVSAHEKDGLILAGDVAESADDLRKCLEFFTRRFRQVVWVPGNHELWTLPNSDGIAGQAKYEQMVAICRSMNVVTPEDEYPIFQVGEKSYRIVPLFLLYDYSFRPAEIPIENAITWAAEHDVICADEHFLRPDPFPSRQDWCAERCRVTWSRLKEIPADEKLILINHFPLRYDLVYLPRIPRFSLWCGTTKTETWHCDLNVEVVVYGHLHIPRTQWRNGIRFEEVSLGYPGQWNKNVAVEQRLRRILPGP